jgi:hypothetical protein
MGRFASALAVSAHGDFVIAPNWAVLVFTLLACVAVPCGLVTAAKGRSGWLLLGFLTSGLLWIVGALQTAMPGSMWQRRLARRARGAQAV